MATLREYFETDFRHTHSVTRTFRLRWRQGKPTFGPSDNTLRIGGRGEIVGLGIPKPEYSMVLAAGLRNRSWREEAVLVEIAGHHDPCSRTKFLSWFVPKGEETLKWALMIVGLTRSALELTVDLVAQRPFSYGEDPMNSWEAEFHGRVFLYHESTISAEEGAVLAESARQQNLSLHLRGPTYASERERREIPDAFISLDSRDKAEIALKLAQALRSRGCAVWYDDFSLKVGDNLRESIEKGIKAARRCILVLTPNFLSNTGWTKAEFNAVFTREILERKNVILPIWHLVSQRDVYEYSPCLAERVALQWSLGEAEVARSLLAALVDEPR